MDYGLKITEQSLPSMLTSRTDFAVTSFSSDSKITYCIKTKRTTFIIIMKLNKTDNRTYEHKHTLSKLFKILNITYRLYFL